MPAVGGGTSQTVWPLQCQQSRELLLDVSEAAKCSQRPNWGIPGAHYTPPPPGLSTTHWVNSEITDAVHLLGSVSGPSRDIARTNAHNARLRVVKATVPAVGGATSHTV
jgi:hypothetical protein